MKLNSQVVPINKVKNWDKNPRTITEQDFSRLKKQIEKFGVYKPLIVCKEGDFYVALGGNMRLRALREIGQTEVWISEVFPKSEQEKIEISLSDNDRAGTYNKEALSELIIPLKNDIDLTAFKVDIKVPNIDLSDVLDAVEPRENNLKVDISEKPKSKLGEVYKLGNHRLMCGDAMKKEDVDKLINGRKIDMVITSPPYNCDIKYKGYDDKKESSEYLQFLKSVLLLCYESLSEGRFIVWNIGVSDKTLHIEQVNLLKEIGFNLYRQVVWKKVGIPWPIFSTTTKKQPLARNYHPNYTHEMIYLFIKGGIVFGEEISINEDGMNDVWEIQQTTAATDLKTLGFRAKGMTHTIKEHPAAFPVKLPTLAINYLTSKKESVYDPFGGSGSTLVACERIDRLCYMMDIEPLYIDLVINRWENLTKGKAEVIN